MALSSAALDFIAGRRPLYAVHQSYAYDGYRLLIRRTAARAPSLAIGSIVSLSTSSPSNAEARMSLGSTADILLADPQLWKHDASGWPSVKPGEPKKAWKHRWWAGTKPHAEDLDKDWIAEVLQTQRDVGANLLLSATGWVDAADSRKSLDDAMRWVQASRDAAGDEPMFVNLAFDLSWLTNPGQRSKLLTEIVESSEDLWYLRFFWPKQTVRYGQLNRADALTGYAQLVATAASEDRRLVLANSGLTGWVATALGASGYSTGTSWPEQAFVDSPGGGGGAGVRKERYFDLNVLHTVEHATQRRIAREPGYVPCHCGYCPTLLGSGAWSYAHAGDHYVTSAASLTEQIVAAADPRAAALASVTAAAAFAARLRGAATLTGDDRPKHLEQWRGLLTP